ncbi:DMT family transporter [Aliisedimentitalea scapharcae]|uniref:DMT family transporter n=1 Tax=Aliisedimentitalea scapharcae TaxID=1524259 RepID=A0ABZ2XWX6_9RHOB
MTVWFGLVVLSAAFLHALWNAIVKGAGDRVITLGMIALGHVVWSLVFIGFVPAPNMAAIPYMVASILIHWVYFFMLNIGYRMGDLSLIYPVARGFAPVMVALGAQGIVGEKLPIQAWIGILCVSLGIMLLARGAFQSALSKNAVFAALGIGGTVVIYTLVDGVGVRLSGNALSYITWLFLSKILIVLFLFPTRIDRLRAEPAKALFLGFMGGIVSGTAYALVLYAKTLAPLGLVSALRETSVIFAALIGVMWFDEGPRSTRLFAAMVVGAGIILIALGK